MPFRILRAGHPTASPATAFVPPLGAGIRASENTVGYFADYGALTEYAPGGAAPSGWAWSGSALTSQANDLVLTNVYINGGSIWCYNNNIIIRKSVIRCGPADIVGITMNGLRQWMTVEDCTIIGQPIQQEVWGRPRFYSWGSVPQPITFDVVSAASGRFVRTASIELVSAGSARIRNSIAGPSGMRQEYGISCDEGLIARRVKVIGTGDCIHYVGKTGGLISQCYAGHQRYDDEEQHCDGFQHYQDGVNGAAFTIEHSYIEKSVSLRGTPMNSACTMGPPASGGSTYTPTINNNYFASGLNHLRFNWMVRNAVVTNNDFGPIDTAAGENSYHDFGQPGSTYTTWSNNRDENGGTIPPP